MLHRHFSLFLALRYLIPKRLFLIIITLISLIGVMFGVAVPILVISVMTGFERELERKVVGFDAHLVISGDGPLFNWRKTEEMVLKQKDVVAVAPFVMGPVLAEFNNRRIAPKIRAIDPEAEVKVSEIGKYVKYGDLDLDGDKTVIGIEMARLLGATIGDKITVYSPGNFDEIFAELDRLEKEGGKADAAMLKQMILPKELEVTGIFESGRYLYDSEIMLVPLYVGQEIYNLADGVHGLSLQTRDRNIADQVKSEIQSVLEPPESALTWMDMNKQIFDAINMERNVMFVLLFFIVIVAAFSIMNTLIIVTVMKTREIGILKALGARKWQIIRVFMAQGIVVGFYGTLLGLLLGTGVVQFRNYLRQYLLNVGIDVFPAKVYEFNAIPAEIVPSDVAIICISAFLICSMAALIPAWFASRLDPVKALRYE